MKSKTISVRIPVKELEELKRLSLDSGLGRSLVLREVLNRGIQDKKLDLAIEKYRKREITLWKAARSAGIPLSKFLDRLDDEGLEYHYLPEEVEEEFEGLQ